MRSGLGFPSCRKPDVERFVSDFGLQPKDADTLVNNKAMADFFEEAVACSNVSKNSDAGRGRETVGCGCWETSHSILTLPEKT